MGYSLSGQTDDQTSSGVNYNQRFGGITVNPKISNQTLLIGGAVLLVAVLLITKGKK